MYEHVIISCGGAKNYSPELVPAYRVYRGQLFKSAFSAASRLSQKIYIISAGYGLINANDLIYSYEAKLNAVRAKFIRENVKFPEGGASLVFGRYRPLLPKSCVNLIPKFQFARASGCGDLYTFFSAVGKELPVKWTPGSGKVREILLVNKDCLRFSEPELENHYPVPWSV